MQMLQKFVTVWDDAVGELPLTVPQNIILTLIAYIVLRALYLIWLHPLSDVPGPRLAALTDFWKMQAVVRWCFSDSLHEQHTKYGDVVRIGPNEVSIIAPDDVKVLYGHKSGFTKGPFYDAFSVNGKSQFSDRDEATHGPRRRKVATAYSLKYLTSLERYCDACTALLFGHLDKLSDNGSVFDLAQLVEWYAYDAVSGISFGKFFGFLENGGDKDGIIHILDQAMETIITAATLSNFSWILPSKPMSLLASAIFGEKGPNFYLGYAGKIVKERQILRETDPVAYEDEKDMLYRFMESTDPETSQPLDTRLLINNTITILMAGADTTKIALSAFLRYVYAHPPTVTRLRKELDDAVSSGNLSFPIPYAQAARLDFMWACMKEAIRLHPAVGMTLQRVVPAGGRVIGGRFYQEGTLVGMSAREIQYDTRAYGKDAGRWRPERWLEGDRNELEKFNLTFGQGSRVCLGKNISLMEMSKLLPTIVYRYDITIVNPERPWTVLQSWFEPQHDFFCSIAKRESVC